MIFVYNHPNIDDLDFFGRLWYVYIMFLWVLAVNLGFTSIILWWAWNTVCPLFHLTALTFMQVAAFVTGMWALSLVAKMFYKDN